MSHASRLEIARRVAQEDLSLLTYDELLKIAEDFAKALDLDAGETEAIMQDARQCSHSDLVAALQMVVSQTLRSHQEA